MLKIGDKIRFTKALYNCWNVVFHRDEIVTVTCLEPFTAISKRMFLSFLIPDDAEWEKVDD